MWHFEYPLEGGRTYGYVERDADGNVLFEEERDYISIATTRPETMLGDGAVAVHPDDERYRPIVGTFCEIPVGPKAHRRLIPIITDDYPDPNFGSGAVKITGGHDLNDYGVAQRNGLPMYRLMDGTAHMRSDGPSYEQSAIRGQAIARGEKASAEEVDALNLVPEAYRGLDRYDARKAVVADIDAEGLMIKVEDKLIVQPFGDRSGMVIEPMLTDQWYVDAETLARPAIAAVRSGDIAVVPETWKKTWFNWLENIQPWCVSRQLWWGHRIPAWYADDGSAYVAETEEEAKAQARGKALRQDEDVLDTWFSSALWPFATLGWPEETPELAAFYPTDLLTTAREILFLWVARMVMMGLEFAGDIPFSDVYVHPVIQAPDGRRMSKSLGTGIDPLDEIEVHGADALRFGLLAMSSTQDVKYSPEKVEQGQALANKLFNASRYVLGRVSEEAAPAPRPATVEDRWILSRLQRVTGETRARIESYDFSKAALGLYDFVYNELCDWYLELTKGREFEADLSATILHVLREELALAHPLIPFVTEEVWGLVPGAHALLAPARYPIVDGALVDPEAERQIGAVIASVRAVRSWREEAGVRAGARLVVRVAAEGYGQTLPLVARLARLEVNGAGDAQAIASVPVPGGALEVLPSADVDPQEAARRGEAGA